MHSSVFFRWSKRAIDIVGAICGLLLVGVVLVALWVLVRIRLGSPVLFRQPRPGLHGRVFTLLKFRTMTDARDHNGELLPDAERLPSFGRWLRSTSMDELPSLWNVLVGDMSLVGPRPLLVQYLPLYTARQRLRHEVRPGITGWAQVNGRNAVDWEERFEMDVWYVENRSLWLDIRILWMTVAKVLARHGVTAAGEATMGAFQGQPTKQAMSETGSMPSASPARAPGAVRARVLAIRSYLPEQVLDNATLAKLFPEWPADKILAKTGIAERRIAAPSQTAADLACEAARRLFETGACAPGDIDFLLLCTQAPDYVLPTTACLLQHRLGIPRSAGALDFNLGCSGFVYGLSLAKGLVETGAARRVLLLTADTYSKYIHPSDKSVRTLFGDGAAATLIGPAEEEDTTAGIGPFVFGTDGSGGGKLIVEAGGFRLPASEETAREVTDDSGNTRSQNHLFMDGADVMTFSLTEVPKAVAALLDRSRRDRDSVDLFVMHQANRFMLDALRKKLKLPEAKLPVLVEHCGNTVSSTIPMALQHLLETGRIQRGTKTMVVGFGVGYSWAAANLDF